jgi:hypothetical protein
MPTGRTISALTVALRTIGKMARLLPVHRGICVRSVTVGESLSKILNDPLYRRNLAISSDKWLDIDDDEAIRWLVRYFKG